MAKKILIKNATIINEEKKFISDLLIVDTKIFEIKPNIKIQDDFEIIDATGKVLIPGLIDDQVHFREPGLTHKATIKSESKAAIAGGITSFIEMPNTIPQTTTVKELKRKFKIALPVIGLKNSLNFKPWIFKEPLYVNKFGILEPKNSKKTIIPDFIMVPLAAYDKKLNRIGYGKGYYDRGLKKIRNIKDFTSCQNVV